MLDLGIVIVSYNTRDLLRRCLQTVYASTGVTFQVVVVDNASKDGSADMVLQEFPQVHLIASAKNGGFSIANNHGLRWLGYSERGVTDSAPRYAVLLNPDTEIPPDALHIITAQMDADPRIGIAGPKLVMANGQMDPACRRSFPTPWVSFTHFSKLGKLFPNSATFARYNMTFRSPDEAYEVDSVVGAYMQIRKQAIAATGLLDETFFMYGEDIDWCYRVKQAGFSVMYLPQTSVLHLKSVVGKKSAKAQFEFYRAMLIFYRKHYRNSTPLPVHWLVMVGLMVKGGRALLTEMRHPSPLKPVQVSLAEKG